MNKKIFVAGHNGMVGSAICRDLANKNNHIIKKSRSQLDLLSQSEVYNFFASEKFEEVYLAAAKAGGIHANNTLPAEFIFENMMIELNIINAAFKTGIKKLLFLGSSCIYPKNANQPILEKELLSGYLEPTNEPYAVAKIAGIKLCESYNRQYGESHGIDYRSIMPTNLYGVNDKYHLEYSHVIPALIRKFHEAKEKKQPQVLVWGSGKPKREFLFVDDLARACRHVMAASKEKYYANINQMCSHINVGSGEDIAISDLAELIKSLVNYNGEIVYDQSKPDGVQRKLLDSKRIRELGWSPQISLTKGLKIAYSDFKKSL